MFETEAPPSLLLAPSTARTLLDHRPQRIAMVTAYDYPSAVHVELAGIHVLLCGDSVGMVRGGARRANTSQTDGFVRRAFSRRLSWATTRRSP